MREHKQVDSVISISSGLRAANLQVFKCCPKAAFFVPGSYFLPIKGSQCGVINPRKVLGWGKDRGEPGSTDPSLNAHLTVFRQDHFTGMSLFLSFWNIPGHSFLSHSHSKAPLGVPQALAQLEWRSHCPQGRVLSSVTVTMRCKKLLWDGLKSAWALPWPSPVGV